MTHAGSLVGDRSPALSLPLGPFVGGRRPTGPSTRSA